MWNYAWEVCWSCVFFPLGVKSDNFDDSRKQKLHTSGKGGFVRSSFIPYHMHIPSILLLLHFLCVYLSFRFHSRLLPCLGINNTTICYNKFQVTCYLNIIISDSFWWWCTNDGAYNSNACIVIAHDLIKHLSLPFLTKFTWSFSYVTRWLFILFMHWNKGQLKFIKSKGKTYMNFLYEKRLFQFKMCCFSLSLMFSRYYVNI